MTDRTMRSLAAYGAVFVAAMTVVAACGTSDPSADQASLIDAQNTASAGQVLNGAGTPSTVAP